MRARPDLTHRRALRGADRDTLLLSAGELTRQALCFLLQTKCFYNMCNMRAIRPVAVQFDRKHDILVNVQHRHEIVTLKHKSDLAPAEDRERIVVKRKNVLSLDLYFSVRRAVQPAEHMKQRRFSAATRPDDRRKLAVLDGQVYPVKRADHRIAAAVILF